MGLTPDPLAYLSLARATSFVGELCMVMLRPYEPFPKKLFIHIRDAVDNRTTHFESLLRLARLHHYKPLSNKSSYIIRDAVDNRTTQFNVIFLAHYTHQQCGGQPQNTFQKRRSTLRLSVLELAELDGLAVSTFPAPNQLSNLFDTLNQATTSPLIAGGVSNRIIIRAGQRTVNNGLIGKNFLSWSGIVPVWVLGLCCELREDGNGYFSVRRMAATWSMDGIMGQWDKHASRTCVTN